MLEELRRLQQEMENLDASFDEKLTTLRVDMQRGFAEQRRLAAEEWAEMRRLLEEQQRRLEQHALQNERSMAGQAASFDQTIAAMQEDLRRHKRNVGVIWSSLIERAAEAQVDIEDLKVATRDINRRMDDLERRLAG